MRFPVEEWPPGSSSGCGIANGNLRAKKGRIAKNPASLGQLAG
jgi:hypothetical protein